MRSDHNLSHEHKLTTDMGKLVPVATMEVLPGDTFIHSTDALVRVASLANPLMHRVELRLHHWFVPNRILWDGWEDMIVGKSDEEVPTLTPSGNAQWELYEHMGVASGHTEPLNAPRS